MPFLTGELLARLAIPAAGAVLAELDGSPQPLPARCLPAQLQQLEQALASSLSLRAAFASLGPTPVREHELRALGEPRLLLFSVNSARDLETARRWMGAAAN